ncbi:phospholipase D-like domain-containing protein [Pseudoruegeria sp. SK021]|uniref:phospholipase D-like domain-containing protein n=1 Tax=Pseudoruegeria sp. SK021 TaxID=1933035 RepID=UPI001F0A9CB3|nr:phospholipase D-like domain-containing protein [Pseudoruegeria sp. SK021]
MRALVTAAEAYPTLERAFLTAETEIWASFRIFDLSTKLRSLEARAIGDSWFELMVHTLQRGVAVHMVITDFDPVAWAEGHRSTWRSMRQFAAAADLAGPDARLRITPAMHPARTSFLLRLAFWPMIMKKLVGTTKTLNAMSPDRRETALRELPGLRQWIILRDDGKVRPRYGSVPPLCPATHHQKLAVFDRQHLYIGGLDLNERRYDTPRHDRDSASTWHDVQIMIDGPVVAEAQAHLESFLDVTAGRAEPVAQKRLLRTISKPRTGVAASIGPKTVCHEILSAHEMLARRSSDLIYIETQFFRDRKLARTLADIGRSKPKLQIILILPGAPEDVAFDGNSGHDARFGEFLQGQALRILQRGFGKRLFIGAAAQAKEGNQTGGNGRHLLADAPIIYIHAKVAVFDDTAAIVSSANLNGRSLKWDTEAGVILDAAPDVVALRRKLMAHWLPDGAGPAFFDRTAAVARWRGLALSNAQRRPSDRQGFVLPYDIKASESFGQAVPFVPEELV